MTTPVLPSLAFVAATLSLTACGGSASSVPVAERVCSGAQHAAMKTLNRSVNSRMVSHDPANVSCLLRGPGVAVALDLRASPDAFTAFNTASAHQSQVFGPGVHEPGQIPRPTTVRGSVVAVWIPAAREILTTDAQPGHSGVFLTVSVKGPAARRGLALNLDREVAQAAFAARPDQNS